MINRLDQQTENGLVTSISEIERSLNELKTGVQYVEARMYEYSSANSYDMTGSLASTSVANQVVGQLIVTATSVDGKPFISTFFPELWIPNMSTPYVDKITNTYLVKFSQIVTDDPTKTQYFINIGARNSGTAASTFYMKAHIYATAPVTVTYARNI